jgi:uncharacterized membrane protein
MIWHKIKINFKNNLLSGLVLTIPLFITIIVLRAIFNLFDDLILPLVQKYLDVNIPGLGIFIGLLLIYLIGMITKNFFAKKAIERGEKILTKIPIAKTVYSSAKQILMTISGPEKSSFKKVLLVEYPRKGIYSVGFLNGEIYNESAEKTLLSVLVVTSVNPTSGFLILVPPEEAMFTKTSVEEAMKLIVSGGIVTPKTLTVGENPYLAKAQTSSMSFKG